MSGGPLEGVEKSLRDQTGIVIRSGFRVAGWKGVTCRTNGCWGMAGAGTEVVAGLMLMALAVFGRQSYFSISGIFGLPARGGYGRILTWLMDAG